MGMYMTTNVGIIGLRMCGRDDECAAESFMSHFFEYPEFPECPGTPFFGYAGCLRLSSRCGDPWYPRFSPPNVLEFPGSFFLVAAKF